MERKYNLNQIGFKKFTREEKRVSFVMMDYALKELHSLNYMVTSFNPEDISYDANQGLYFFDKIASIDRYQSTFNTDKKKEAVLDNIIGLSKLALYSYLDSDIKYTFLNNDFISDRFNDFAVNFYPEDVNYYRSILVDGYKNHELPKQIYYADYILNNEKNNNSKSNSSSLAYTKATEIGKMMTEKENKEAAFGNGFFFVTVVASMIVLMIGVIIYFINI